MKKIDLAFMNKLEEKFFNPRKDENAIPDAIMYVPVSNWILLTSFVAVVTTVVLVIVLQIFNISQETGGLIMYAMLGLGLLYCGYIVYKAQALISSTGMKIGLCVYALVLYILSFVLFFKLIAFALMVAATIFGGWLVLKYVFHGGSSQRVKIEREDGTVEYGTKSKGLLGEDYIEGDSGRTY